jgi:hypothetical protein
MTYRYIFNEFNEFLSDFTDLLLKVLIEDFKEKIIF